jgi:hypothetical protein
VGEAKPDEDIQKVKGKESKVKSMKKSINVCLALAGLVLASVGLTGQGQGQGQAPAQTPAAAGQGTGRQGGGGRGTPFQLPVAPFPNNMGQGGNGAIKVLFVSKGHDFDRDGLMTFFDQLGRDITWTHVEQPAAQVFYDQKNAAGFDVLAFYDAPGRAPRTVDGKTVFDDATPEAKVAFAQMLMAGKGLVFLHHSIAAWTHTWPEYQEVVGGACDWSNEIDYRKQHYPRSGAFGHTKQHVTIVEPASPIVAGLGDGYDIVDEAYACPYADDKTIHPLLRTDFVPQDPARNLGPKGKYSNLVGWYKSAENSPVVWIEHGHDTSAWANPAFQTLVVNSIRWAASPDAMAWAKKNPTKIFKNVKPLKPVKTSN